MLKTKDKTPLFSVIVPVYNAEKTLDRCVKSILSQTVDDLELILIDDGSPDRSGSICDSYASADSRVKVIHKVNGGVSAARNVGLDIACGRWVVFVDADDWVEPNHLEIMTLEPDADLRVCAYFWHSDDSSDGKASELPETVFRGNENILSALNAYYCFNLWTPWGIRFSRAKIASEEIRFNPLLSFGEDSLFILDYMKDIQSLSFTSVPTVHYNANAEGSLSKKKSTTDNAFLFLEELSVRTGKYSQRFGIQIYKAFAEIYLLNFQRAIEAILNSTKPGSERTKVIRVLFKSNAGTVLRRNYAGIKKGNGKRLADILVLLHAWPLLTRLISKTGGY